MVGRRADGTRCGPCLRAASAAIVKLQIASVGRWSNGGPEKALYEHYADRIGKAGRSVGLGPLALKEVVFRKPVSQREEAVALLDATPNQAYVIALDETGKTFTSKDLATKIAQQRDESVPDMSFLIGGSDGHGQEVIDKSDTTLNLGSMTWPHLLVRGLVAEQIYRAITILSGHPYHRG